MLAQLRTGFMASVDVKHHVYLLLLTSYTELRSCVKEEVDLGLRP